LRDTESKAVGFVSLLKAYGFGLHRHPLKIYRWLKFGLLVAKSRVVSVL